jgi:hypothetical protein
VDLEGIAVLHVELRRYMLVEKVRRRQVMTRMTRATHSLWVVGRVDSLTVEEESHTGRGFALTLAEGVHELLELGGALDFEVDLVVVVGHFDVQVLAALGLLGW